MISFKVVSLFSLVLVLGPLLGPLSVLAHSWVEEERVINPDGSFGDSIGYPRGNILRGTTAFNDNLLINRLPIGFNPGYTSVADIQKMDAATPMCRESQTKGNQTPGSPALKASPGDMVALRYQENGHVSILEPGKPLNSGTVYIYGTLEPKEDEKLLDIFGKWNAAGTGGDGRGFLLATRNYDDGRCHQNNAGEISQARQAKFPHANVAPQGDNIWCQTDIVLPYGLPTGVQLTLYWVWNWSTEEIPAVPQGKVEMYTSCMDIDLVTGPGTSKSLSYDRNQDILNASIEEQLTEPFIVKTPETEGTLSLPLANQPANNIQNPQPATPTKVESAIPEASPVETPAAEVPVVDNSDSVTTEVNQVIISTLTVYTNSPTAFETKTVYMTAGQAPPANPTAVTPVGARPAVQPFVINSSAPEAQAQVTAAPVPSPESGEEVIYVTTEVRATVTTTAFGGAYTALPTHGVRNHVRSHARAFGARHGRRSRL